MAGHDPQFAAELLIRSALSQLRWGRWAPDHAPRDYLPDGPLLVGFSGGSDSLGLLLATIGYIRRQLAAATGAVGAEISGENLPVIAIHVDHRMRPDSTHDAQRAAALAGQLGVRCEILSPPQAAPTPVRGAGLEDYARAIRYGLLAEAGQRHRASAVLVGHTEDDQAETLLLSLAHGAGARAQGGMSVVSVLADSDIPLLRPFLPAARALPAAVVERAGLSALEDPTNDPDGPWRTVAGDPLPRIAVRHRVLPALAQALGQDVRPALARLAELYREDDQALNELAQATFTKLIRTTSQPPAAEVGEAEGGAEGEAKGNAEGDAGRASGREIALPTAALKELAPAIERRVLALAGEQCGWLARDITGRHYQAMQRLIRGGSRGPLDLPGGVRVWRAASSCTKKSEQMIVFSPARG